MQNLSIDEAQPGDKLAKDLRMNDGSILLAKGAELNNSLIVRLQRMGITEIVVEGDMDSNSNNSQETLSALEHRFRGHENNELMMELKETIKALITSSA